jgi:hypothetical protein
VAVGDEHAPVIPFGDDDTQIVHCEIAKLAQHDIDQ